MSKRLTCLDCGKPITSRSKTGRCHPCSRSSPEARANNSAAQTGKKLTPQHRANIGAAQRGRKRTPN